MRRASSHWGSWEWSRLIALALAFRRWQLLLPLAIVATLPFRVPLHAGGDTANLLVPLYVVIAGGECWHISRGWRGGEGSLAPSTGPARHLPWVLAGVVVLYALQTLYSPDFSKSLQNVCFFFVPFSWSTRCSGTWSGIGSCWSS